MSRRWKSSYVYDITMLRVLGKGRMGNGDVKAKCVDRRCQALLARRGLARAGELNP